MVQLNSSLLVLVLIAVGVGRIHASTEPLDEFRAFTFTVHDDDDVNTDNEDKWNSSNDRAYHNSNEADTTILSASLIYEQDESPDETTAYFVAEEYYDQSEQTDEDDDDDDDDGHSSMLSTASLRRRMVSCRGDDGYYDKSDSGSSGYDGGQVSSPTKAVALNMRGGGSGNMASSLSTLSFSFGGSALARRLYVTAIVTLAFELCIGHILEFLKIVRQTTADITYAQVIREVTREKGILGLWDGFVPWGVIQAVFKGAVFGLAHAVSKKYLVPLGEAGTIPMLMALTVSGGIGGGFQGYVLSPTLLLKTRVMTNPAFREPMNAMRTIWLSLMIGTEIVREEGILTLMKGSNVFALKRVFDWSSRYLFADVVEGLLLHVTGRPALNVQQRSFASFMGGVLSTCVTLPLDVLVAKTQDAKKAGVKVSALAMFQQELKEKGILGLCGAYMQGFEARLLHVCLTTVVIKTVTPVVYDEMYAKLS